MLIGVIADDFTGASDIANTLARGLPAEGGLRTAQFIGVPKGPSPADVTAGVIALKSRAIATDRAVAQSLEALDWLRAQGCRQIVFKYCSTFDSTPDGNIGPVAEALAEAMGVKGVVVCPAFPRNGRTLYQGHLFVQDRLLSESGMQFHPATPMTDPDIRRWLRKQAADPVGHAALDIVRAGSAALKESLDQAVARGERLVVVDAIADQDLIAIGAACADAPLITGGSGVAMGLPRNLIRRGIVPPEAAGFSPIPGPAAILSGSCSTATQEQVRVHASSHPALAIDPAEVLAGRTTAEATADFLLAHPDALPIAYSSAPPARVRELQERWGAAILADALDRFFGDTARMLVDRGIRRLIVAGGETSGAVVSSLDEGALLIGPEIDPGVPVLLSQASGVGLALKSGNFGGPDFFEKAARIMSGGSIMETVA